MTEATGIVGEFFSLKDGAEADLLAMQVGDFYEFFGDDAETVADELDLQVSKKSSHGSSYPMAGVPVGELTPYLTALVERGYDVAVADQHETADGHARKVTRVVTPGTLLSRTDASARYLAAIVEGEAWGLAFADVTTGEFFVTDVDDRDAVFSELYRFDPAEMLPGPTVRADDETIERLRERTDAAVSLHATEAFAPGRARHRLREHFGPETIESVGIEDADAAIAAAGAVLSYVEETGQGVLASMTRLQRYGASDHVELDATTQRNLELTETMRGEASGSLLDTIDHTVTSAGTRTLRAWLQRPRRSRETLEMRADSVEALTTEAMARERLRDVLGDAYDLERLASKAASGSADARDLRAAVDTLELFATVRKIVAETPSLAESPLSQWLDEPDPDAIAELAAELDAAIVEDPPGTVTEGGIIRSGYDEELDAVIDEHEAALEWIETLPEREQRDHGITHLSVDRNKTDGYYIQVGKSEVENVPDHYENVKTLKNSERYTIPELTERERTIFRLEERRYDLEHRLFEELRERVAEHADRLQRVGQALAAVDVLAALSTHAVRNDWTRPELRDTRALDVEAGRHPVVEQTTEFVPNDLRMDDDRRFLIVTGPNMSGKSTYMRQAALIVLLAQIGSFVPARSAAVGIVDGIYTRVGALDELAQGRSTFMVEMQELANILHSATEESLVILDEVGRGTATYDGVSIAWAATEYLSSAQSASPSPKTLFATHYHELTSLADHIAGVENVHVAVDGEPATSSGAGTASDDAVTFLRTVRDGPADRSYGVHVAELAGVPDPVVSRARDVLERLRADEAIEVQNGQTGGGTRQVVFDLDAGQMREAGGDDGQTGDATTDGKPIVDRFGEDAPDVLETLADLDVETMSPVDLLAEVQEWQRRLE
ncbi:DNA mismatch repair protein MutS 1 [Halorhabdus tiamatea SARL4B]|uniref:DNA mismatch repair protein MutS n=1 Tax=Halorhabdus tiamatea SARL4B TaxID=1033806 RepID=F7PG36_9EURY|nr:DNA mismatch repair protein MutS [Halorhabdus tiamatea]ERJ06300.1 DNA mismatch repair protein MutS 1 [Halorhabdus tiamatea SARL4B]CCQ34646.1 DNA mismatch repair protein, MutS family [Halorhabdus tiamatea SARL4B]